MLTDTERKLLLMLWHLYHSNAAHIDIPKIARLSGRKPAQIRAALCALAEAGYAEWDSAAGVVRVFTGWEHRTLQQPQRQWGSWPD